MDDGNGDGAPPISDTLARAAIQASPRFAGSIEILYTDLRKRWSARGQTVIDQVERVATAEQIQARLAESEQLDAAVLAAITAAAASGLDAKRRLLGRVVANAVLDDAKVDEASLIVDVLAQIDAPHVRCLEAVRRAKDEARAADELGPVARGAEQEISQRVLDAAASYPAPVLQRLISVGLLDGHVSWDGVSIIAGTTTFGDQIVDELRKSAG